MDTTLEWLKLIDDDIQRKCVAMYSIYDKDLERHIYTFRKIAKAIHTSPHVARNRYQLGLRKVWVGVNNLQGKTNVWGKIELYMR